MAYIPANLSLVTQSIGNKGMAIWTLEGTDAHTSIDAAGYISDGGDKGMKVGDLLIYHDTDSTVTSSHYVLTVSATAPGATNVNAGTEIGLAASGD